TKWLIKLCSWFGLAGKLRTSPPLKVEKAKASMALIYAQRKIAALPNQQLAMARIQREFDALVGHLQEYYELK
ncbi:acyl-CoA desaturase, partial [Vibrio anguillarum]|nr:acyl-CoA desaturase [Vibrio anguillarum]